MTIKPQLADDANLNAVMYPCWVQPKIDGVRALQPGQLFVGRSLDPFKGFGITEHWSWPAHTGFDGEMTLGDNPASPDRLCSNTTGAMGRFKGVTEMADLHWWLFDLVDEQTRHWPYRERYDALRVHVEQLNNPRLHLVPYQECHNREQLDAAIAEHLDLGYEGTIIRNPNAIHKPGRPGKKVQELWRVKPWMDSEMLVDELVEGNKNTNEAKTNTLGRTERSSSKEGMVPNGEVGSIKGTLIEDIISPITGAVLFKKGLCVEIGSGEMTVKEAGEYFRNPHTIVKHIAKFKHLAHGTKDLPRMGTFVSLRLPQDMS